MTSEFDSWQPCRVRSKVCVYNWKAENFSLYKRLPLALQDC